MRCHSTLFCVVIPALFSLTLFSPKATFAAEPLQAGVAVVDITPPVPFRMSGYFNERLSTGTKDPLHAKACVLRQGDQSAALVFCDLVGVPRYLTLQARAQASQATGIPADHIAIAATHSHTGPLIFGPLHDHFHERNVERLGKDPHDSAGYRAELVNKIVRAIRDAHSALQPVELSAGFAQEDRLSFNRRFHMSDGSVRFNPGELNPNIVRPAGPIDPQVGIVGLNAPGGEAKRPFAAIVAFAMHLDTLGGTEYSADYPKFVEHRLREALDPSFTLLFASGTCGDINHIDVSTRERRKTEQIGTMLGERVAEAIQQGTLSRVTQPTLAVRSAMVEAPLQKYSDSEVAEARRKMDLIGTRQLPFLDQVEAAKIVDLQRWEDGKLSLEVQVFRLGSETAIVTLPAEVFVELGLAIKTASPFNTTLVIELANDSLGYIPTRKAFAEGSYETVNSRVEPGTGEGLVEAAIDLLRELK